MASNWLAALPVYNEANTVSNVLQQVFEYADNVLAVNDGSSDGTAERLREWPQLRVVHHAENRGYGAALVSAFNYAIEHEFEYLVTLDCDGQHQPKRIPRFIAACQNADIVSGSRYLKKYPGDSQPPAQRLFINRQITRQINQRLGLCLTDAFCGFKAYRVSALKSLNITDFGYAMPLEVWVQAAMLGMRIIEVPVPLIYLDLNRSFGGALDEAETRMRYYNECLERSIAAMQARGFTLPQRDRACHECP
jgi:dolichol-phosphate mannosyltransferase